MPVCLLNMCLRARYTRRMTNKSFATSRIKILEGQVKKLQDDLDKAVILNKSLHEENESVWFLIKELMESEQLTKEMLKHLESIVNDRKYSALFAEKARGTA